MSKFIALDVETANSDYSSICQIGLVVFEDGVATSSWSSLIDPKCHFDNINISIHGIAEADVMDKPTFLDVYELLSELFEDKIIIHHGHFDKSAFSKAYELHDLAPIKCDWLDSTIIVRRTWQEFSKSGYGLKNLTRSFGIEFKHHDALEDARVAGEIVNRALVVSNKNISQWLESSKRKLNTSAHNKKKPNPKGNADGPYYGQKLVFSGSLINIGLEKPEATIIAQKLGFDVQDRLTKKTTYLILGEQRDARYSVNNKSSKQIKAESMLENGEDMTIMSAENFIALAVRYLEDKQNAS